MAFSLFRHSSRNCLTQLEIVATETENSLEILFLVLPSSRKSLTIFFLNSVSYLLIILKNLHKNIFCIIRLLCYNSIIPLHSGEKKTSEELGFNTDLSKAQEKTKDEEKHLNAELHTDLIDKEKRDEIVSAGRKIVAVVDALTEDKGADKFDIYKAGLRAIHIDELRKDKEKEFAFIDDENTAPLDKLRALRELQSELYRREGYEGALPELYLTDEPNSFAVDGKNGGTRKIFISLNDLKRGNPSALLYGHENAHLVYYDKDEEIAKYAETKIGESKSKNKFTSKEQKEYLSNLRKNVSIAKTLEEQFSLAKSIPSEDRENYELISIVTEGAKGPGGIETEIGIIYNKDQHYLT